MKSKLVLLFLVLFSSSIIAQDIDKLANLPDKYYDQEIRIYRDRGITNSGSIFRIYNTQNGWKAEKIQWFLLKEISPEVFKSIPSVKTDYPLKKT